MKTGRVLVIGLGRTGVAVCEALLPAPGITAYEQERSPATQQAADALSGRGVRIVFGAPSPELLDGIELVVPSPGVPPVHPLIAGAVSRGIPVRSEVEVGFQMTTAPVTAVTGTNGKTTVTTLIARILKRGGLDAAASGNIGFPFITAARKSTRDTELVCEVSSFQLEYTDAFRPAVALVTNVAPDHLDWHESYASYLAAKAKITANQNAGDLLIIGAGDEGGSRIAQGSKARIALFGLRPPEDLRQSTAAGLFAETIAGIDRGAVIVEQDGKRSELIGVTDIRLTGAHNLENVMAACLAGRERGVAADAIAEAVSSFEGLPHRSRLVAEIKGVRYINDSKATNPAAAIAACRGLQRVILIAGGRAKGLDLTALGELRPSLKAVVVMGESARQMARVFDGVRCYRANWVEDAVDVAAGLAREGDTVLLSPGCSSLDQYVSYAERGDRFAAKVKQLER